MSARHDEDRVGEAGLMTVAQVAAYLALSRETIYRMMTDGRLSYTLIGRSRRIPRKDVIALANRSLVTGPAG